MKDFDFVSQLCDLLVLVPEIIGMILLMGFFFFLIKLPFLGQFFCDTLIEIISKLLKIHQSGLELLSFKRCR